MSDAADVTRATDSIKRHALPFSTEGRKLTELLTKAAGLDGKRVRSIECRCAAGEVITFKAELYANEGDIGKALADGEA